MKNVSVKYQSWLMRLWMFLFPFIASISVLAIRGMIYQGDNAIADFQQSQTFYLNLSLFLASIIVLLVVAFRDEVVNRYLLMFYFFFIEAFVLVVFGYTAVPSIYLLVFVLLSVFISTMLFSPYGFIGIQYKKRSTVIYSSSLFFILLASWVALYTLQNWDPGFFLVQYWALRKVVLYFFDEAKTISMTQRIFGILISFVVLVSIFYGVAQLPNLLEYYFSP